MILIGSRALRFRAPQLLLNPPKDFDFIAYRDEALEWLEKHNINDFVIEGDKIIAESALVEFEIIRPNTSSELLVKLVEEDPKTIKTDFGMIPNLNLLFALKASHRYLKNSPHFWKTAIHYHAMKDFGCEILPEYQEFFKMREKETYARQNHPKLNVKKDQFFGDDIKCEIDHDFIHECVKFFDKPAYEYYKKDGEEVLCDKQKFFNVDETIRIAGGCEESAVLAIERSLLPFPGKMTPKQAWLFALSKVCSSITSGFFRSWCYDNIFTIIKNYPENYWQNFQDKLKEGNVRYR